MMLKVKTYILFVIFCALWLNSRGEQGKPNIVFIMADDLGWMDVVYNGSRFYETPNLDALAQRGMAFSRAYTAAPVCAPTRGSIMSGKYPVTSGYTGLPGQHGKPSKGKLIDADFEPGLPLEEFTLAEALKEGGYKCMHIGKWHLGEEEEYAPDKQGFDFSQTGFEGAKWKGKRFRQADNKFITDHLTDIAIAKVKEKRGEPFFLNLWYYAVHTPVKAKAEDIEYFTEKARRMGLDTISPFEKGENYLACPWFDQQRTEKHISRRVVQSDPVYAAFVYCLDYNIGRMVKSLEDEGLMENTIVVFFSDNGGLSSAEGSPTSNFPLHEGKGWVYEGGQRVPCIVAWDKHIKSRQEYDKPIVSTDFYPTLLDLAGFDLLPSQHVDGVSLVPALNGNDKFERGDIYWHSPHYFNNGGYPFKAIVHKNWKYVYNYHEEKAMLFDIENDLGEQKNLLGDNPKKAKQLEKRLNSWLNTIDPQYPKKNPDY